MQLRRNEILTGLLVLATVAVLTVILILLGAPGLFRPLVTYRIYLDNAAGIKLGAPVLLAGRKIGQVEKLYSPVSKEDARARSRRGAPAASCTRAIRSPTPAEQTEIRSAHRRAGGSERARLQRRQGAADHARACSAKWRSNYPGQRELRPRRTMARCSRANASRISANRSPRCSTSSSRWRRKRPTL